MNTTELKSAIKSKIRTSVALISTTVTSQYDFVGTYLTTLIDEATPEEIEFIIERLDEAGHHLAHAYRQASAAVAVGAGVAERASNDPHVEAKLDVVEARANQMADFMDSTAELAFGRKEEILENFPRTQKALGTGAPGDGQADVPEEEVGVSA